MKKLSQLIDDKVLYSTDNGKHFEWNNWVPKKVNVCVWRASLNRLPTLCNLSLRGLDIASSVCPLCESHQESIVHCLVECRCVKTLWLKFWNWWGVVPTFGASLIDRILGAGGPSRNSVMSKVFQGATFTLLWSIWRWRNRIAHANMDDQVRLRQDDIFPAFQRQSLLWVSNRCNKISVNWAGWISNPSAYFGT